MEKQDISNSPAFIRGIESLLINPNPNNPAEYFSKNPCHPPMVKGEEKASQGLWKYEH